MGVVFLLNVLDQINNLQQETLEIWQKLLNEKLSQVFNNQENLKITENNVPTLIPFCTYNFHQLMYLQFN